MSETMNPWFSIWTKPRATMRSILDSDPKQMNILLVALGGIGSLMSSAIEESAALGLSLPVLFISIVILGAVVGIISWYIISALIKLTGRWIGGAGDIVAIRSAAAWSNIPSIYLLAVSVVLMLIFGAELYSSSPDSASMTISMAYALMGVGVITMVIGIWAMVIYCKILGEAQGFSAWKALLNSILAMLVIAIPVAVIFIALD